MISDLEARGFIHVRCNACAKPDVWFKCNECGKSDHFLIADQHVQCACGATYKHGTCLCGSEVSEEGLVFTPFNEGPMALADLEIDKTRLALFVGALVLIGGLIAYALI